MLLRSATEVPRDADLPPAAEELPR
jgi:hypothetical protein